MHEAVKMDKKIIISVLVFFLAIPIAISPTTTTLPLSQVSINQIYEKVRTSDVTMNFFGTEYSPNQTATIWLQLLQNYQPINNATCFLTVYYPNKTVFLPNNTIMQYLGNSDGLYYYDLNTPFPNGVYMLSAKCLYITSENPYYAQSRTLNWGSETGTYTDTWVQDSQFHHIKETKTGGIWGFDIDYNFYDVAIPTNYTGLVINWFGQWVDYANDVKLYLYNWCNISWDWLPYQISGGNPQLSFFLPKDQWNLSCYHGTVLQPWLLFKMNSSNPIASQTLDNDFLQVKTQYLTYGETNDIRGSGEMHILNSTRTQMEIDIAELKNLINSTNSSIFAKLYAMQDEITSVNDTVKSEHNTTNSLIGSLNQNMANNFTLTNGLINSTNITSSWWFNYINSTLNSMNSTIPSSVWNYATRTLTAFGFAVNLTQNAFDLIWSYNNRTLTYYPSGLNASDVWNYWNRTVINVTYTQNVENVTTVYNVTNLSDAVVDSVALRVVQYFYALKDKLLSVRLW